MVWLKTICLIGVVMLASAFISSDARAHAGHSHEPVSAFDSAGKHHSDNQTDLDEASLEAHDHTGMSSGVICEYGCCTGLCATCCLAIGEAEPQVLVYFPSINLSLWRYYRTPDDAISMPDTPPPRV